MSKGDIVNLFVNLLSGAFGALIGTYFGVRCLYWKKYNSVREVAIKALNIFNKYAKKSYKEAASDFNNGLNISEKRAVVVALQKIGVPFSVISTDGGFNINNLCFEDIKIDKDEINEMIQQVKNGSCDSLFFEDVESYFTSNLRLKAVRGIGKKYVEEVLSKSHISKDNTKVIVYPSNWYNLFSPGEMQTLCTFHRRTAEDGYFKADGSVNPTAIENLHREIDLGIWDNYLFWNYELYQNVQNQNAVCNLIRNSSGSLLITQNQNRQPLEKKSD